MASKAKGQSVDTILAKADENAQDQRKQQEAAGDAERQRMATMDRLMALWERCYTNHFPTLHSSIVEFCKALTRDKSEAVKRFAQFDARYYSAEEISALLLIQLYLTEGQTALASELEKRSTDMDKSREWMRPFDDCNLFRLVFDEGAAERRYQDEVGRLEPLEERLRLAEQKYQQRLDEQVPPAAPTAAEMQSDDQKWQSCRKNLFDATIGATKQFELVEAVVNAQGRWVDFLSLAETVWGNDETTSKAIAQMIKRVNETLENIGAPLGIRTDGEKAKAIFF